MTINKVFKDVYSNLLEEYGYQYCAKLKRFVKVVNKELIFFLGLKKVSALKKNNKSFTITAGIMSIYFSKSAEWTVNCTEDELFKWSFNYTGKEIYFFSPTREYGWGFEYNQDNMVEVVNKSVEITKKIIFPIFDEVNDLLSYVKYAKKYNLIALGGCDKFLDDSLVLILTNDHDDFMGYLKNVEEKDREFIKQRIKEIYTMPRDKVYNDPELLKAALEEAEKCKEINLKMLESYKINIL